MISSLYCLVFPYPAMPHSTFMCIFLLCFLCSLHLFHDWELVWKFWAKVIPTTSFLLSHFLHPFFSSLVSLFYIVTYPSIIRIVQVLVLSFSDYSYNSLTILLSCEHSIWQHLIYSLYEYPFPVLCVVDRREFRSCTSNPFHTTPQCLINVHNIGLCGFYLT